MRYKRKLPVVRAGKFRIAGHNITEGRRIMEIYFYKYQGTGNDFVILDNRSRIYSGLQTKQIEMICNRRFGIGADGLMLLNEKEGFQK